MQKVIGVQYKPASKVYYFNPNGKEYSIGQTVIVDTANGLAFGVVSESEKMIDESTLELPLKNAIRVASEDDLRKIVRIKAKSKKSIDIIKDKIEQLKLKMSIVDAEYSFDETRITIYFTSDARVDFRELLKVLAASLKTKIELRQIGVREEVKQVGGLGLCGMPCCCTRFLKDPAHITVKMVKLQNLSLNPAKTGGLCGRMMCCLAFEDPIYKEAYNRMPKVGSTITTKDGVGTVQYNDLMNEITTIKLQTGEDNYTYKEYKIAELEMRKEEAEEVSTNEEKTLDKEDKNSNTKDSRIKLEKAASDNGGKAERYNNSKENRKKKFHKNFRNNNNKNSNQKQKENK